MHSPARKWLQFSFVNLLLVATLGIILRYKILFSLPFVDQKHLLHAHSHFAFAGWVTHTLMVFMVQYLSAQTTEPVFKKYRFLLVANLVTAYGMLLSFPFEGYGPWSISFSTLSILVSYAFTIRFLGDLKKTKQRQASHPWFRFALFCNVFSSLGAFGLAFMMATHTIHQNWYLLAVYFFLHFQYNGWFFFACSGLLISRLQHIASLKHAFNRGFWLFALSCLPAYFLSALWLPLPLMAYIIVVASALAQLAGTGIMFNAMRRSKENIRELFHVKGRWLLILAAIALLIKLLLQAGSTHPALSQLAFGFRPIIIGYLHLVLLGVISIFLLGYMLSTQLVTVTRARINGIRIFVTAILFNETALMVQGIAALIYQSVPYINHLLLSAALLLFTGILVITISGNKNSN